ncbi:MAG TPA: gliding motility-associated C-terminal domain-containing protein, partial [Saprospiraceae bacterium]|nr:gliding motility-associated C-terminal domain-containing protein [Saprospiraceae bacterium]
QIDLSDPCISVAAGTPIIFHDYPSVNFVNNDTICLGQEANLLINITGISPFDLMIFREGSLFLSPNTTNNSYTLKDNPISDQLYTIWVSGKYCDNKTLDSSYVHVNVSPTVINIKHVCNSDNLSYIVSFDIVGGDPSSYKVSNIAGTLTGNSFTSAAITVNQAYNIFVDDKFACGPFIVAGSYNCQCETSAGVINNANITACVGDTIIIDHTGEFLDGNDILEYLVSKNANPDFSDIVFSSDKALIWFGPITMVVGDKYYVKIVAGNKIVSTNMVDPNDPCISYSNIIELTFRESPQFIILASDTNFISCDKFNLQLKSNPEYSSSLYVNDWKTDFGNIVGTTSSTSIYTNTNGNYTLTVTDIQGGCSSTSKYTVNIIPELPVINKLADMEIGCQVKQLFLNAFGSSNAYPFELNWSTADGHIVSATNNVKIEIDKPGEYILQVMNSLTNCTIRDTINVLAIPDIKLDDIIIQDPSCAGTATGSITANSISVGKAPFIFKLSNGTQNNTGLFNKLVNDTYILNIQDSKGCLFDTTLTLNDPELLQIELGPDITIEWGELIELKAQINVPINEIDTLIWANIDSASCDFCLTPVYIAKKSSIIKAKLIKEGCSATDEMRVIVEKTRHIFIPNVFSPNADGINDKLYVFGDKRVSLVKSFVIYDRWGEQVFNAEDFQSDGQSGGWDGRFKGRYMNPQVVVYYALIQFIDGAIELFKGDVSISR